MCSVYCCTYSLHVGVLHIEESAYWINILFLPLQIAHLNSTINDLQKKVKLPGSANTITQDIESLKKGMADTGGDITEIKDKIKQLTKLASQENGKVDELSKNVFNLSVSTFYLIYFKILHAIWIWYKV